MAHDYTIRTLTPEDLDALFEVRQVAFLDESDPQDPQVRALQEATLVHKRGCFLDGELASSASWYPFQMYVHGTRHEVAGLASVLTAAEHRRKGCARALLADGLERLHERGAAWCLEYPFDTRYYARFGWQTVDNGAFFEVPTERFAPLGAEHTLRRVHPGDEQVRARLARIHEEWARGYTFTMARTDSVRPHWDYILEGSPWDDERLRLVYAGQNAYVVARIDHHEGAQLLRVIDMAWTGSAGRRGLLRFLGGLRGQVDRVRLQLPGDDPLRHEWANFVVAHPHPLQARVVDVPAALELHAPEGPVDVVLEVEDDFCAWNNARLRLRAGATGDTLDVEPTTDAVDVLADVRGLALLLSGAVTARAAASTGLVRGLLEALAQLGHLSAHPTHMPLADYF